jgi:pimeloyl-ACP methyl ester carboxylesterase
MLEMLNPTGGDMLRFAATVVKVRSALNRAMKTDPAIAQTLAVETFCAPPSAARRTPDIERLRDDARRFFGWKNEQWKVHGYWWAANVNLDKALRGKPRGRMLLCHGWEGYALNFALLIQKAVDMGYEVHAFDHLAHGRSEGTQSGLPIALETLLTVAEYVKRNYGNVDVLAGHSLGGAASSWAAAHRKIDVKKLVLIAPFYDTRKLSGLWAKAHFLSEDIRAILQSGLENASGKKFTDFMPAALAAQLTETRALPVLIVHDRSDKVTDFKHSAALSEMAHNVTLHEARKVGHIAVLADKASMNAVMNFVRA